MRAKLLFYLRYLQPSFPVARFSTLKPVKTIRVIPIFSRIFPHKLKYQSFGSLSLASDNNSKQEEVKNQFSNTMRKFPSRSGRGRTGSGSGQEIRASKSLVEDETEFSDLVSGLGSDSFKKTRLFNDSHKDNNESRSDGFGKGRGKGREEMRGKRKRGSGFDDSRGPSRLGGSRGSGEKFPRRENGGGNVSSRQKGSELNERFSGGARGKARFGGEVEGRREKKRRGPGSHFEMDRDGGSRIRRGEKGERQRGLVVAKEDDVDEDEDEDEEDKGYGSFKELIGSDEGSEEVDDDDDEEEEEEEGDDVSNTETVLAQRVSEDGGRGSSPGSPGGSDSYLSETRFDQVSVSPLSMKGLKDAGYEKMTVVQEATLPVILKGKDVMAKAKTGTGKTVAFLLPSIEVVVKTPPAPRDQKRSPILILVICPTRELANQAAQEANKLLKYHPSIGVQVVIGGTRLALEQKRIQKNPCQILVATPGRLRDHIENTAGFATQLMGVKVLVLDEADHLLNMGFRKDIEKIIAAVPKQRQTLLFSATIPQEVRQICHIALKRDHEYINSVQEGTEETHAQVRQMHLISPLDNHFSIVYALLKEHIADNVDYKVLVFCTTAMVTRLVAELLSKLNLNVREIHSRKSQSYRTKVSDEFRKKKGLILVTSDVSARGVDYPDVTLVIQIGLPSDRQQYIHRLGRTGRKGKEGQGILLLAPWEEFFLSTIKDLPLSKAPAPLVDPDTRKKVERALSQVGMKEKESAYQAWLGYYNSNKTISRDKCRLVELANEFSRTMGLDNPPAIPKLVLGKMGLKNVPGLRSK